MTRTDRCSLIQSAASVVADRRTTLSLFYCLPAAGFQRFCLYRGSARRRVPVEVDQVIDHVIAVLVIRHEDQLDLPAGTTAKIDADTPGGALFFIVLAEQLHKNIGRE